MSEHVDTLPPPPPSGNFRIAPATGLYPTTSAITTVSKRVPTTLSASPVLNWSLVAVSLVNPARHWLEDVYSDVRSGRTEKAIDLLFERIDTLLNDEDFDGCDDVICKIDFARLDTNLMIAALTITLAAKDRLRKRRQMVERVESRLQSIAPDRVERLLAGLR